MTDQELNEANLEARKSGWFCVHSQLPTACKYCEVQEGHLNEAVARKLGWVQCCNPKTMEHGKIIDCFGWSKGGSHFHQPYPAYSTSIAAAWEIIQDMPGVQVWSNIDTDPKAWHCTMWNEKDMAGNTVVADAETAPLAICKAFLKCHENR